MTDEGGPAGQFDVHEDDPAGHGGAVGTGPVRVVLVDDQPLMTAGIRMILETDPGIRVVATTEDGAAGVAATRRTRPDLVCMDVQMPVLDGLSATREITADPGLGCAVLMLTTFRSEDYLVEALRAGACGYLLKNTPPERLISAVHSAAAGDGLVAPELTGALIRRALQVPAPDADPRGRTGDPGQDPHRQAVPPGQAAPDTLGDPALPADLTPREVEVLRLMAEGMSNEEIAAHLVLGRATVKTHVSNILMKLAVRDRVQAVVWAHRHGLAG